MFIEASGTWLEGGRRCGGASMRCCGGEKQPSHLWVAASFRGGALGCLVSKQRGASTIPQAPSTEVPTRTEPTQPAASFILHPSQSRRCFRAVYFASSMIKVGCIRLTESNQYRKETNNCSKLISAHRWISTSGAVWSQQVRVNQPSSAATVAVAGGNSCGGAFLLVLPLFPTTKK